MAYLDPQIKSPPFSMPPGHFTMDQLYGLKVDDQQLFFPQAYGTQVNCVNSWSWVLIIYQTKDTFQEFGTKGMCVWSRSVLSDSLHPMDCNLLAPWSMRFSRQEYWSGLPFPFPGDLPSPGIESGSPTVQADALPSEPPGENRTKGVVLG